MPPLLDGPQAFGIAIVAVVLIAYGVVALARKQRFKRLAAALDATFVDTGVFAAGRVTGHDFVIEAHTVGLGRYKRYRTSVQVTRPDAPGPYLMKPQFFERFPDWTFGLALGVHSERAFVVTVEWPRYREATPDERQALLEWLRRKGTLDPRRVYQTLQALRVKEVTVEKGGVRVSFPGAVSRVDRLRDTLVLLRSLGA